MRISDWSADVCSSDLASCELWGLLKRTDEKYVTERAYENPKFVEDLVRDVAVQLQGVSAIQRFRVVAENFESIHNHSAYAVVEGDRKSTRLNAVTNAHLVCGLLLEQKKLTINRVSYTRRSSS